MKAPPTSSVASRRVAESIAVKQLILQDETYIHTLEKVALLVAEALRAGHKLLFMGNGGSAADAQHLTAEFTGRYLRERRALPAIALTVNTSSLTAIGNDYCFDSVFERQLEALGRAGDVAIALSTSGNSSNILRAMKAARRLNINTVALSGKSGGLLKNVVDYCLCVPSTETSRIQESHIMCGHIICEIVEDELFA